MSEPTREPLYVPPAGTGGGKILTLFVAILALVGATVYLFLQVNTLKTDLNATKDALASQLEKVRETSSLNSQSHKKNVEALKDQLESARKQASLLAGQAKVEANKKTEEIAARLAAEQKRAEQAVKAEITQVKDAATATNAKIGEVSTEVGSVKTEVASTKSELEKTVANLKRVTGDLSSQGSLIATNSSELSALKALGERNYIEFKLPKAKEPQKVGDISLLLKKADLKKNRYTIEVVVDDKRVEKKDKTINEPVQFMTSKARQPYEIVVNDVKKDQIAGYLATPKVTTARN